ncbi:MULTISPECIES: response regulator [Pseudomonas]|uniref:response regulator n=1 Tax=Pseudomonas TaxID=286 RepID=UPI001238FE92|nr:MULTISPECIES: response regulator [Pseudomonas]MBA1247494.1 response regulator [Pseudomonas zeshuii]MBW5414466.1 response regulator [Pseudomonas sp. MAG002Y]QEU29035.1 response regulator [Pseudomonas luteola]
MSKNIMIVDDSATMLMSLRSSLEMSGFKVEAANDGVQAMNKLQGGYKPDLIITDINMPNMGGLELIGKARALPGMRFVPILALTTESQQSKRDEAKKNGATGWLVKPVGAADLLKVIKQVLPGA